MYRRSLLRARESVWRKLALLIPIIAILGSIFLSALKITKGSDRRSSRPEETEETRIIQDVYRGLQKMEDRIDALETILMDMERSRKGNG